MNEFIKMLISSVLGTVGFGILFKMQAKKLITVAFLGGGCITLYYLFSNVLKTNAFVSAIVATLFVSVAAELLARVLQAPAVIFIIPSIIPIVPGGALYRFMKGLINGSVSEALPYGKEAILTALGVAGGIIVVSIVVNIVMGILENLRQGTKNKYS
ncbi:MAG: threonine/serine exporter [Ruminococcaceae bacterium]|nr:threonine/serine exporter [Oscillospiraceae bacterium]